MEKTLNTEKSKLETTSTTVQNYLSMPKSFFCLFIYYCIYLKEEKLGGKWKRAINIQKVDCYLRNQCKSLEAKSIVMKIAVVVKLNKGELEQETKIVSYYRPKYI